MPALKDIKSFKFNLANSRLANSPLWNQAVESIHPAQLHAFRAKLKLEGHEGADSLFKKITDALIDAQRTGDIKGAPILRYSEPATHTITAQAVRMAFERMTRPMPAAILFGLETGLTPERLVTLTWPKAKLLVLSGKVKTYARQILEAQPRHLNSEYVFWQQRGRSSPQPLFGLEMDVFEEFGMVWSELQEAYRKMTLNNN